MDVRVVGVEQVSTFVDNYRHETREKVLLMEFFGLAPVYYDSDIKEKNYPPNMERT